VGAIIGITRRDIIAVQSGWIRCGFPIRTHMTPKSIVRVRIELTHTTQRRYAKMLWVHQGPPDTGVVAQAKPPRKTCVASGLDTRIPVTAISQKEISNDLSVQRRVAPYREWPPRSHRIGHIGPLPLRQQSTVPVSRRAYMVRRQRKRKPCFGPLHLINRTSCKFARLCPTAFFRGTRWPQADTTHPGDDIR